MPDLLYVLIEWLIPLLMVPVVARRRRPFVAISWLAVIFAIPWVGLPIYLLFGEYGLRRSARQHRRVREEIGAAAFVDAQRPYTQQTFSDDAHRAFREITQRLLDEDVGACHVLGGNHVEWVEDEGAIDRLVADIDSAERHVHLLFFIYVEDETGQRVADALARAAERGAECRLLVDRYGSRTMLRNLEPWLTRRGVEVHSTLRMNPLQFPFRRIDIRNHRKIAIIDGRIGYTGSTNIHDADHELDQGRWRQISVRLTGPTVLQLQTLFVEDWYLRTDELLSGDDLFPEPVHDGSIPAQLVPDGPSYPGHYIQHLYIEALNCARSRVIITSPYFVPDESLIVALRLAALRGVRVDVIMPEESDRRPADIAGRANFAELMGAGVRIHLLPRDLVHAKTVSVDDTLAIVGTANFDRRSLFLNYEMILLIYDGGCAARLREIQERYLEQTRRVDEEEWDRRPRVQRIKEDVIKLLSPLL